MNKRIIQNKNSKNIRKGKLTEKELKTYKLKDNEINIILTYQEKLPILQEDNDSWVNTRYLHEQLKLSRQYDKWIKNIFEQLDLNYEIDIKSLKTISKNKDDGRPKTDYYVTTETAKEIAMIAGIGNRVNPETKELSKITRKYFIYIEKALRNRIEWNYDRDGTLIKCKTLKQAIVKYNNELSKTKPIYMDNNFVSEFCLLNEAIIQMSASRYRQINGLKKSEPIRNTFDEKTLEYIYELEVYDADLIMINNEFDRNKRLELLKKKYNLIHI